MKVRTHSAMDGHIEVTVFPTEDLAEILKVCESLNPGMQYKLHEHTDLPDYSKIDKWREVNGQIIVDETIETSKEKADKIKETLKAKLTALNFTKEEMEILIQ